jgi:hypothetical protein
MVIILTIHHSIKSQINIKFTKKNRNMQAYDNYLKKPKTLQYYTFVIQMHMYSICI